MYRVDCCEPCKCEIPNGYMFPAPIRKAQKLMEATQLTIHKDINISEECVIGKCCVPEPVKVKTEKKSFVISACADEICPNTYYTLQIDREVPVEAFGLDTYINVQPRGFYRGEVGLEYSEVKHFVCHQKAPLFENNRDNLPSLEIDGENTYALGETSEFDGGCHGGCHGGEIPKDPAFPAQNFGCGCGFKVSKGGVLIPVVLDLHGNIATGRNFTTGRFPANGYRPYNNRYVLYLNNRGEFSLCRPWARRSDYA